MADPFRKNPAAEMPGLLEWRRLAERALDGRDFAALQSRTRDGVLIEPLYGPRLDAPLPGRAAASWKIVQIVDDPDPERANAQALRDVEGGASGLSLRLADRATAGAGLPRSEEALRYALHGIDLAAVHLRIDPHARGLETARWLRELVARQGVAPERADISWGLDPLALAVPKQDGVDAMHLAAGFSALRDAGFAGALAEIDTRRIHEAGGSEAQELAAFLAGAVWWLRALDGAGLSAAAALPFFGASVAVDRDQFVSIAKLRALRLLWSRLLELCAAPGLPLQVHAETSRRMMTRADPHSNLVRTTIAAFAAAVAGADSVAILPFTAASGLPDGSARAHARNIQHLLIEESHLYRVADPGAGSGFVEALTDGLAEAAWAEFQRIEQEGGLVKSLRAEKFQARVADARKALQTEVASGAAPLVGATIYRQAGDAGVAQTAEAARTSSGGLAPISLEALAEAAA